MIPVLTKEQAYELDKSTIESGLMTERELIDNAGYSIACHILENFKSPFNLKIGIVVGKGNNGSDGIVLHYYLSKWNCKSELILINERLRQSKVLHDYGIPFTDIKVYTEELDFNQFDLVIDAILGIGNNRKLDKKLVDLIEKINISKNLISIDMPSGLMTNSGKMKDFSVFSRQTHTMGYPKLAHFINDGLVTVGELQIHDIGFPDFYPVKFSLIEELDIYELIEITHPNVHKYSKGKLLVIGGSEKYSGAAELVSMAGFRSGAGYLKLIVPDEIKKSINSNYPELIVIKYNKSELEELVKWSDAVVLGPGLEIDFIEIKSILDEIKKQDKPIVIDASIFDFFNKELNIKDCPKRTIFTPHNGELKMFYSNSNYDFVNEPILFLEEFIDYLQGRYCLIKGQPNFLVNSDGSINLMSHGSTVLATAGTGDVLSGLIGGLLAQGYNESVAMQLGSWIHAESALIFTENYGREGMVASDLLSYIPLAFEKYINAK